MLNAALMAGGRQIRMTALARSSAYEDGLRFAAAGRHHDAIGRFEQALAAEPESPRVLFALGNTARALGLARPAEEFYRRVLAQEPARLEALVNLANLLRARGDFRAAIALLEPHAAQTPELWLTLGSAWRELGDAVRAEQHYREALTLRPDYAAALCNLADMLTDAGDYEAARDFYARAIAKEPQNAQARLNRAVLHLLAGNLKDGWKDYAARLNVPGKVPVPDHRLKRWDGASLKRTRLLVTCEQGVGDQMMFAGTFVDLVTRAKADGGTILLECEPRLAPLFARSFPDAAVYPAKLHTKDGAVHATYDWLKSAGGANAFIEMGSLPKILRKDLPHFPAPNAYLVPDESEQRYWRSNFESVGGGPAVGICWRSGKSGGARALQYAPPEAWAAFLKDVPGTLICTQYDASTEEVAQLETLSGRTILMPQGIDQKNELDRTCALLSALDCVISAPTAVSWLASGAGVPTFKILYDTSWTAFGCDYEPFAPSCRLMMPATRGDWADTFAKTLRDIRARF